MSGLEVCFPDEVTQAEQFCLTLVTLLRYLFLSLRNNRSTTQSTITLKVGSKAL